MDEKTYSPVPAFSLLALIAITHLPFSLPPITGFIIPSIVIVLIFIWSLESPENLPPWLIFTLGLIADVLSSGPIGYWPLYYLCAQAFSFWFARNPVNTGLLLSWIGFLFTAFVTTFLGWAVATLYFVRIAEWQPMIIGAAIVAISYPLIFWLSGASRERAPSGANERLWLGGEE